MWSQHKRSQEYIFNIIFKNCRTIKTIFFSDAFNILIVGGLPWDTKTEVFRLDAGDLYRCNNKINAGVESSSAVGGDVFGKSILCGGNTPDGRTDDCVEYDVSQDIFVVGPTFPVAAEQSASTVLPDGTWWIAGGITPEKYNSVVYIVTNR